MNWEKIKWFYEVCKELNISKTAERLNISQPALSRHISFLEEGMACKLFNRSHSGLTLTEMGVKLFDLSKKMAENARSIEELTAVTSKVHGNNLKVETSVTLATMWFPHYIPKFLKLNPEIQLTLEGLHDESKFLTGNADVAITTHLPDRKDLIQKYLMTFHLGLYASPDYLKKMGTPLSVDDLKLHKFIVYGQDEPHKYGSDINALFKENSNFKAVSPIVINMGASIVTVASKGLGIIVLSSEYPGLPEANLKRILPEVQCEVDVFLSFSKKNVAYNPIKKLETFFKKELKKKKSTDLEKNGSTPKDN